MNLKSNRVLWPERNTGKERQSEKRALLGQRLNYHLPLVKTTVALGCPAKAYHMMGKACFQPTNTETHTHTHTSSNRHVHLHTPTHTQSSAVSATRRKLSSHTQTRPGFPTEKSWAAKEKTETPKTALSYPQVPTHILLITNAFVVRPVDSLGLKPPASFTRVNSWHQRSVSPSCTVVTSVSGASLMQLRTSQCYPTLQKEVDLSQSVSCRVSHTSHCCLCAFSLIASLPARFLSVAGMKPFFSFFFQLHSHYWSFWWVMPHWLKYILYLSWATELFHCKHRV